MKLTLRERKAIELLRMLDSRQRNETLATIERQVTANRITARVGKLRRLRIVDDRKIVKAFGTAPLWKLR